MGRLATPVARPQEYHSLQMAPTNKYAHSLTHYPTLPPTDGVERYFFQKRDGIAQTASTLNKVSFGSLASALPHQLPNAETGKRLGKAARVGGDRALAAIKRSVRVIAAARYFSQAGITARYERGGTAANSASGGSVHRKSCQIYPDINQRRLVYIKYECNM